MPGSTRLPRLLRPRPTRAPPLLDPPSSRPIRRARASRLGSPDRGESDAARVTCRCMWSAPRSAATRLCWQGRSRIQCPTRRTTSRRFHDDRMINKALREHVEHRVSWPSAGSRGACRAGRLPWPASLAALARPYAAPSRPACRAPTGRAGQWQLIFIAEGAGTAGARQAAARWASAAQSASEHVRRSVSVPLVGPSRNVCQTSAARSSAVRYGRTSGDSPTSRNFAADGRGRL